MFNFKLILIIISSIRKIFY